MKKLICKIFGHKFKYIGGISPRYYSCRCGKERMTFEIGIKKWKGVVGSKGIS